MVTLALIGIGDWGLNHLRTIEEIPQAQLKYICAATEKTLQSLPGKYIKTQNYETLFQYQDIDGVIIATPTSTHFQIAKDFLNRGFHLLIEKPLVTNYQEALKLKKIYDQNQSQILVGHVFQYHPAYIKAKELVKKLGFIRYLDFEGLDLGPFRNDVSALWDWAPHDITMCLDIMKQMPLEVRGWEIDQLRPGKGLADLIVLRLTFDKKVFAWMKMGWLSPVKKRRMLIVGTQSSVVFDDTMERKVIFFKGVGPRVKGRQVTKRRTKIIYPSYSQTLPLKRELLEFIECIQKKKKPETDMEQALRTMKVIHWAEKSIAQSGKPMKMI